MTTFFSQSLRDILNQRMNFNSHTFYSKFKTALIVDEPTWIIYFFCFNHIIRKERKLGADIIFCNYAVYSLLSLKQQRPEVGCR